MTDIVERLQELSNNLRSADYLIDADIARDARDEIERLRAASQWQSIETAPKDGTEVIVYRRDAGAFTAHYISPYDVGVSDDDEPSWFTVCGEDLTGDLPTHWQPLPSPPTQEATE